MNAQLLSLALLCGQPVGGDVRDERGPVAGARVRIQGAAESCLSDHDGRFQLRVERAKSPTITAWKKGYAIAARPLGKAPLQLSLTRLPALDNPDYEWIDPAPHPKRANNCANCHREIHDEWAASAHAGAATNRRLRNLFEGTDWHGGRSPKWSLKDEHPLGMGVCASCHAPTYRDPTLAYDLSKVTGVAARGVHCDYCHKVADAPTDKLGTRFGRDGLILLRPAKDEQLFFGPLDDAVRPGEMFSYSSLYKESRYCASCHEGVIFGVHVYGTYSEWLESPARAKGQQCQDCHMKPTGKLTNIAPGKGGIERDPRTLAAHRLPRAEELLKDSLSVMVTSRRSKETVAITVEVRATNVGHRVPTGFSDRNLVLAVEGFDKKGEGVPVQEGPKLQAATGKTLAGAAGQLFAKQLLTDDRPVPFWMSPAQTLDTRLIPERPERSQFRFAPTVDQLRVRLIYRRAWHDIAVAKGWPDNEVVVIDRKTRID
jgi:hypothetical protein